VKITDNHFTRDFFHLDEKDTCFEIPIELTFKDGKFIFDELSSWIDDIIEVMSHFLMESTSDNFILSGPEGNYGNYMKIFAD
jgi:hypothetical protein